jgi:hypothetical protein
VGDLVVKIFVLCFGYLRSQFVRVLEVKICESAKTQSKDFYLQHSHKLRMEVTKTQCKDFLPPALSQIENRGNQNTKQRFLPSALSQIVFNL